MPYFICIMQQADNDKTCNYNHIYNQKSINNQRRSFNRVLTFSKYGDEGRREVFNTICKVTFVILGFTTPSPPSYSLV